MFSLGMGDSGSWVVQGSKLLGHVFAIQDKTRWSYMIPIAQVIDDIQRSLLTCSVELPTPANHGAVSSFCPEAGRSHASLVAFGVNVCPSCKQNLNLIEYSQDNEVLPEENLAEGQVSFGHDEHSQDEDTLPKNDFAEGQVSFGHDEHSQDEYTMPRDDFARARVSFGHDEHIQDKYTMPKDDFARARVSFDHDEHSDSYSSESESSESSSHTGSDHSNMASTVPTSYMASTVPSSHGASTRARSYGVSTRARTYMLPRQHLRTETESNGDYYFPLSSTFEYSELNVTPLGNPREIPYVELKVVLDKVQPPNRTLENLLLKGDISNIFDFVNPINHNVRTTRLTLVTSSLNTAFRHVCPWYPATAPLKSQIVLEEPYAVLVHILPKLTTYAAELRGMNTVERSSPDTSGKDKQSKISKPPNHARHDDIEALIYFTQRFIDVANVASESSRHKRNACIFGNLWLLFQPGMTVYARDGNSRGLAAYIVSAIDTPGSILRPSYNRGQPYLVHLWRLHYDGRYVTRQTCSAKIDYFDGERDVATLKVFPCECLDKTDGGKARRKLEEQGRRWYQLLRGGAVQYSGKLPARPDPVRALRSNTSTSIQS